MLDERDLQAIAQLMDTKLDQGLTRQKTEIMQEMGRQKAEIMQEMGQQKAEMMQGLTRQKSDIMQEMGRQKAEVMHEVGALMEAYFEPKFNLLADGQKLIREKMVTVEDLERIEGRLDVLEAVVKRHSREIESLKKAQ